MELIVVMLVIGTVLAIAAPSLRGFADSRQGGDAAMRIVALTHWARSNAVVEGRVCRLNVDAQTCWVTVQRGAGQVAVEDPRARRVTWSGGLSLTHDVGGFEEDAEYVQFTPDGRCDVARIRVKGSRGEEYLIVCEAPTERFRVISPSEGGS